MTEITDDNGIVWTWDGKRVFSQEAEQEIGENGGNGYPATSLREAMKVLVDGGYIANKYCECGEEFDKDCNGNQRCPNCDPPCPCCSDGPGYMAEDEPEDD